ncbi:hypothetical protein TREVI0001_2171 [Treponema vincentii ATCC 35580]|uniref:Uncharacterized protein n=1 Tax=Treponema vincentii ATCC 35580 TaxID=596324 RepID=C8PPQ1_9SPIR|nr:hypothetical protein TREVI0001_2171 [Treponema vincentii ATCC 35580]
MLSAAAIDDLPKKLSLSLQDWLGIVVFTVGFWTTAAYQ